MIQGDTYKFLCYKDSNSSKWFALMLYHSAIMFFKKIKRVSNFDSLKEHSEQVLAARSIEELTSINTPLESEEAFMDEIKLGICFENYMKGILVENGYLVHRIKPHIGSTAYNELKTLKSQQTNKQSN
ncbi:MAG: hypothetical protein JKY54_07165 [Flavobacteriales bacterium]|nr:hypothetical protein [Flavobacteriales bacterium]